MATSSYAELTALILARRRPGRSLLVSVDGPGGSGKSTIARALATAAGWRLVQADDFYKPSQQRYLGPPDRRPVAADFDLERLELQVLRPLCAGQVTRYQRYDWERDALSEPVELVAQGGLIVEGIYTGVERHRPYYTCHVWVECPRETRLRRGLERDGEAARCRWVDDWMPQEDFYMQSERPAERADIVLLGGDRAGLDPTNQVFIQRA
jgi:uridine kinase